MGDLSKFYCKSKNYMSLDGKFCCCHLVSGVFRPQMHVFWGPMGKKSQISKNDGHIRYVAIIFGNSWTWWEHCVLRDEDGISWIQKMRATEDSELWLFCFFETVMPFFIDFFYKICVCHIKVELCHFHLNFAIFHSNSVSSLNWGLISLLSWWWKHVSSCS